ncbi:hypothetical protein LCGC14_1530120 [marine sediment metagenome]|uniref:Methyltransferase domain-containing protein n=1 Tax=marine sediment metagenome TaxID=412755 RepID=A0A0F9IW19_9ZZZZ
MHRSDVLKGWEPRWAQELYDRCAWFYDATRLFWTVRLAELQLNSLFAERIGATSRVLELAPGTGVNVARLFDCAGDFKSYLGIDISSAMLDRARGNARNDPRIAFKLGDATDLSNLDGTFDFVVSTWLLSHLPYPELTVGRVLKHLHPGGTATFLFFSHPDNRLLARLMTKCFHLFQCAPVDAEAICSLPHLEAMHRYRGGTSTLVIFRRPEETI